MLTELAVTNLGVIADALLVLGPGMTAITGETGAGKTLLVDAIELLVGGRADAALVRPGASEAVVEARFAGVATLAAAPPDQDDASGAPGDGGEMILRRAIGSNGRSRSHVDGRMATVGALAEAGRVLVDIHGQHAHQSLLSPGAQRAALDAHAGVDLSPLRQAVARVALLRAELAEIGGDARARAREIDLLRYQVAELDAAHIDDVDEDAKLEQIEDVLCDATALREAATAAHAALSDDDGAVDVVRTALARVGGRPPLAATADRLHGVVADLDDIAHDLRSAAEGFEDDPERLDEVRARRQLLRDLQRKYGETLTDVADFSRDAGQRLLHLDGLEVRAEAIEAELTVADATAAAAARVVAATRRAAAPSLGMAITARLATLAMGRAVVRVDVGDADPGDDVTFVLAANPGEPGGPLARAGSGGELARTMLATRLVLGPAASGCGASIGTLVFDEVDAGIGGEAARAVGAALAELARHHQVLVVTHLPQVAACADAQLTVVKHVVVADGFERTVAAVGVVEGEARVAEIARMLAGDAASSAAHAAAADLLADGQRAADGRAGAE